jgi:exopolyphosphatase/guanosine-5'-triphosphate,3'-diphosphate pyrophosphatase
MNPKRIAVIDLGTNTFHLLISDTEDGVIDSVYSEKIPVRIGKGGINHGFIPEDACERALSAIKNFKQKIDEYSVGEVYATATSAFRNARNGKELAEKIKETTGIEINIIAGDREAELIYFGVKEAVILGDERALIVDIGGGSVEFILANEQTIFWKESLEIGGQRLMDLFQKSDPITAEEIQALHEFLSGKLETLGAALLRFPATTLIGSSGSFETLSEMDLKMKGADYSIETQKEYEIALEDLLQLCKDLIKKDRDSRMKIPGMIELRVDMIVVASVLIWFIIDRFEIKRLRVSTYALKEGVLSSIMKGEKLI